MKNERRNFYRILHLQPDAPPEIVQANFRTLMQKLRMHPDLGGDHWDAAQLGEAYTILSDPAKRAAYDEQLLASYDLATLSSGQAGGKRGGGLHRRRHGNGRSYYRLLQVQHDAPQAVVDACARSLAAAGTLEPRIVEEIVAILREPARRHAYDEALEALGHAAAAALALGEAAGAAEPPPSPGGDPLRITRFCAFCKTPHEPLGNSPTGATCCECSSPLSAPPEALAELARRCVARVDRDDTVEFYTYWPGRPVRAQLADLSPTGMRMVAASRFEADDCLKIEGHAFRAVGAVAHQSGSGRARMVGLRFLTIDFRRERGSFARVTA